MNPTLCHINLTRNFRGSERQTELLIRELASRGYAQSVVTRGSGLLSGHVTDIPGLARMEIEQPFIRHARSLRGMFLHAHDNKGAHLAHAARVLAGCDYLITRRVSSPPSKSWATRRMYRKASGVAVVAEAIGEVMRTELPGLSTVCIPSAMAGLPVDRDNAAALRREFGGRCVVGHVGALDEKTKGQNDLITAARTLLSEDDGWRFVFVGGGDDEAELRAATADCEALHFVGHRDNVGDYLAAFDMFAFPSLREGIGSTLLDAMDAGLPIVSSNVGGLPELIEDGRTGLLISPRDPEALTNALRTLRNDPALAQRLAGAGKTKVLNYSVPIMADRYLELYERLGVRLEKYA